MELLRNPGGLSRFLSNSLEFRRLGGSITNVWPILRDFHDRAGNAKGHYFHQDLLVASFVFEKRPTRHIDVGSRIDGFVSHVAAFREIEVVDFRPLENLSAHRIVFLQKDMMSRESMGRSVADSLSCLHAIEHFGLGRYGEPIDPEGHLKGFLNLITMLDVDGYLYLSFPIATRNETHFNAHRVFHPLDVLSWPGCKDHLELRRFDYVDDDGDLHLDHDLSVSAPLLVYGCGIYTFQKTKM